LSEKGYHIYLLSNLSCDAADYIKERYDLFDQVDGYVLSCDVNCIKPDTKIYQILLDNYHLKPHESVFLDDLKDNVESARALGMYGIQVVDEDKALKELYEVIEEDQNVEEKAKD
jgi:putative hydrolase of the HAD superfamily